MPSRRSVSDVSHAEAPLTLVSNSRVSYASFVCSRSEIWDPRMILIIIGVLIDTMRLPIFDGGSNNVCVCLSVKGTVKSVIPLL